MTMPPKIVRVYRKLKILTVYRVTDEGVYRKEKQYDIAIGTKQYETPAGYYFINAKAKNPDWKMPNSDWIPKEKRGTIVPGGHPNNPLKAWFLSLSGGQGYGIHGTAAEDSIGTAASHGCIRMRVDDINDLAQRVGVGAIVDIR